MVCKLQSSVTWSLQDLVLKGVRHPKLPRTTEEACCFDGRGLADGVDGWKDISLQPYSDSVLLIPVLQAAPNKPINDLLATPTATTLPSDVERGCDSAPSV